MSQPPYNPTPGAVPPPKKSGGGSAVFWIVGIVAVVGLLCCGGCVLGGFGVIGAATGQFKEKIAANPVVQEHLGEVSSATMNFTRTGEKSNEMGGENHLVFDVVGSKASGEVYIHTDPQMNIDSGTLTMPSGETYDLMGGDATADGIEVAPEEVMETEEVDVE